MPFEKKSQLHQSILCHAAAFCMIVSENCYYIDCVLKNDTDVAHYNFHIHQPILVIFGTDVAKTVPVHYRMVIC